MLHCFACQTRSPLQPKGPTCRPFLRQMNLDSAGRRLLKVRDGEAKLLQLDGSSWGRLVGQVGRGGYHSLSSVLHFSFSRFFGQSTQGLWETWRVWQQFLGPSHSSEQMVSDWLMMVWYKLLELPRAKQRHLGLCFIAVPIL